MPDFRERVAWGHTTPRTVRAAGLPNIKGEFGYLNNGGVFATGAFALNKTGEYVGGGSSSDRTVTLDASRSSSIYGKSTTVQPPALTTRFLIRAKS